MVETREAFMNKLFLILFVLAAPVMALDPEVLPLAPEEAGMILPKLTAADRDIAVKEWLKRFEEARQQVSLAEAGLKEERVRLEAEGERLGMTGSDDPWWDVVSRNRRAAGLRRLQLRRIKVEKLEQETEEKRHEEAVLGLKLRALRLETEGPGEALVKACADWSLGWLELLEKYSKASPRWVAQLAEREREYYRRLRKLEDGREEAEGALKRLDKITQRDEGRGQRDEKPPQGPK